MTAGKRCPACGTGCAVDAPRCWVCGAGFDPRGAARPAPQPRREAAPGGYSGFAWAALLVGLGFVAALIGVELALQWAGLLIPYALIVLVTFATLGRTAYVHLGQKRGREGGNARSDLVAGVAIGVSAVIVVLAVLAVAVVAAVVIFAAMCIGIVFMLES